MNLKNRRRRVIRMEQCNELLRCIGSHGRGFFYSKERFGYARFEISKNGRIWWVDHYSGKRVYAHVYGYLGRGFTDGGTLNCLVQALVRYIVHNEPIGLPAQLGPWPKWVCDGDPWGYGEDMEIVRNKAVALGVAKGLPTSGIGVVDENR